MGNGHLDIKAETVSIALWSLTMDVWWTRWQECMFKYVLAQYTDLYNIMGIAIYGLNQSSIIPRIWWNSLWIFSWTWRSWKCTKTIHPQLQRWKYSRNWSQKISERPKVSKYWSHTASTYWRRCGPKVLWNFFTSMVTMLRNG